MFRHKKCKGRLFLDLSQCLRAVSPSVRISHNGISTGIVELREARGSTILFCEKCEEVFDTRSDEQIKGVEYQCQTCSKYFPLNKLHNVERTTTCCETCLSFLKREGEGTPSEILQEVMMYTKLPSDVKTVLLSEIVKKPIKI